MVILGIDPGYAIVGYGLVAYEKSKFRMLSYGAITTEAGLPIEERLHQIYDGMDAIFRKCPVDAMAVEQLFFNTNQTTGIAVAEARGIILLSAHQHNIPIYEYTPLQVKSAVVGYGRAEKKQVMEMTRLILGLESVPKPDDAADALAIAICHGHTGSSSLNKLIREGKYK